MKTSGTRRPTDIALTGYESLIREAQGHTSTVFPPEKELAERWDVSQSAVNRAALRLIAAGRLRRSGYKLMPAAMESGGVTFAGARLAILTHRVARYAAVVDEAARRGLQAEEIFYIGRDSLRHHLRLVAQKRFDAVIFLLCEGGWEWDNETAEFDRLKIPYVVCEEAPPGHNLATDDLHGATASLISHLSGLGHTNLVCLGNPRRVHRSAAVRQAYEETCLRLGLQESARQLYEVSSELRDVVRSTLRRMRSECPAATAVLLSEADLIKVVLAAAKSENLHVPHDLSVVSVGDSVEARNSQPAVTCAGFESRTLGHVALDLVCQNLIEVRRTGRLLPRQRLRLEAALRLRASVAARTTGAMAGLDSGRNDAHRTSRVWPQAREQRLREAEESWQQPQSLAVGAPPGAFVPVDLSSLANRSFTHQNSWLGHLPLLHFSSGRKLIHGVVFDVIDERRNRGCAAVVLRSHRSLSTAGRLLPVEIAVPIRRRVRAVYLLHACGYAGEPAPFSWYDFYLSDHRPISVPMIARGMGEPSPDGPAPNIQDWWPDFPQFNGAGVRHLVVTENGDAFDYERYLYTLEWVNPHPDTELTTLYIRSNPTMETTLALLGITLLVD